MCHLGNAIIAAFFKHDKPKNRLFWPAPFRDELLARLLKLNEERAAAEKKSN